MTNVPTQLFDPDDGEPERSLEMSVPGAQAGESDEYASREPILKVEYLDPRNVELELIKASWGRLRELPLDDTLAIVVTADLRGSCEEREVELYRTWSAFRTAGQVTSKAVVAPDGQRFIFVEARLVLRELFDFEGMPALPEALVHTECSLERLLEHEGLHLVIRARGEGADVTCCECQVGGDRAADQFRMIASLALEEFRVEREQCEAGRFLDKNVSATIPLDMQRYRSAFLKSFSAGGGEAAASTLNDLAMELAAIVAAHIAGDQLDQRLFAETRWQQIVGPAWDELVRELEQVPGALTRVDRLQLDSAIDALARCLQGLFGRLGFTLEDAPDGGILFSADPDASSLEP